MREKILFNENWLFHTGDLEYDIPTSKGPIYTQSKTERMKWGPASFHYNDNPDDFRLDVEFNNHRWDTVSLPHDYVIQQAPCEAENNALGYFKYENAWYRKHFIIPKEDENKRVTLYFEGIATHATVYLNGCLIKRNFCGYTSFEADITDYIKYDEDNVVAIYVNTQNHEGWWYEGGGIYRNVWLVKTDLVAVELYGVYAAPTKLDDDNWQVNFETTIINEQCNDADVHIKTYIYDALDNVVSTAKADAKVSDKSKKTLLYSTTVSKPVLWDIDQPYLYNIITEVYKSGKLCDTYKTRTGFRTYYADPNEGFFLNGRHIKIKGVCAHQDCGLTGKAVADSVNRYKVSLIKEMGANGYRTSHYPQNEAIMDALDETGFIVMAETRWYDSTDEAKEQLEMLIKRDRNRPSVFFWSIGNEEPYHITEQGRKICKSLVSFIKKLDNTRIIMTAVSNNPELATVFDSLDAVGVNYNLHTYDMLHEKYPDLPIFSSECCATGTTRGWYHDDCPEKGYMSSYDKDTTNWFLGREKTWKFITDRKYVLGSYQWIAFEHRGETVWPRLCSQSGAIDLFLQKKDAFYQNQSHWSDKPMIHMLPHWNIDAEDGDMIKVYAYTNCDEAELILNGKSFGRQTVEKYTHVEWNVPYEKGVIEAIGCVGGKEVSRHKNKTAGKPAKLMLRAENKVSQKGDEIIVTCYTVDSEGIFVPDACPTVEFFANSHGTVIATGSDISDHNPVTDSVRKMRAGLITVAVRVNDTDGKARLYAKSENLDSAILDIDFE